MPDNRITTTLTTLDQTVVVGCEDNPLVGIEVSGTWAGTLNIETNLDPDNPLWRAGKVFTEAGVAAPATITANGRWVVQAAIVGQVRARLNPATSGAVVVTLRAGDNETFGLGGGGGGGGAVTIADGASAALGTTTDTGIITDIAGTALGFLRGAIKFWLNFLARFPAALTGAGNLKAAVLEALPAGEAVLGVVGGVTNTVLVTPTITAGAYTSGDSLGGKLTFANAARIAGGSGVIQSITVTDKAKKNNAIDFLFFIAGDPASTTFTDHSQLTINATDLLNCKMVSFPASQYTSLATNSVGSLANISLPFKLASGTTLYVAAVARGTTAYASTSDLSFRISFWQD